MANMRQNAAIRINVSSTADIVGMETYFRGGRLALLIIKTRRIFKLVEYNINIRYISGQQTSGHFNDTAKSNKKHSLMVMWLML